MENERQDEIRNNYRKKKSLNDHDCKTSLYIFFTSSFFSLLNRAGTSKQLFEKRATIVISNAIEKITSFT